MLRRLKHIQLLFLENSKLLNTIVLYIGPCSKIVINKKDIKEFNIGVSHNNYKITIVFNNNTFINVNDKLITNVYFA